MQVPHINDTLSGCIIIADFVMRVSYVKSLIQRLFICNLHSVIGGCGPVHKQLAYHAGAWRSFMCGDIAASQTAEQTANKGCTNVCIKSGTSKWTFHEPQNL